MPRFERLEDRWLLSDPALTPAYVPPEQQFWSEGGYLTGPSSEDPVTIVRQYLSSQASSLGLTAQDATDAIVTDCYTDSDSGQTHVYMRQTDNSLPIINCNLVATVMPDGRILNLDEDFVPLASTGASPAMQLDSSPSLSAAQALGCAAGALGLPWSGPPTLASGDVLEKFDSSTISDPQLSTSPVTAKLEYVATQSGMSLAWEFVIQPSEEHCYDVDVDASSGAMVGEADLVDDFAATGNVSTDASSGAAVGEAGLVGNPTATYNVYTPPTKSPDYGSPSLVSEPSSPYSPYGWHNTGGAGGTQYTTTSGNNVFAAIDTAGTYTNTYSPSGGSSLTFNFPIDLTQAPSAYENASVTESVLSLQLAARRPCGVWFHRGGGKFSGDQLHRPGHRRRPGAGLCPGRLDA